MLMLKYTPDFRLGMHISAMLIKEIYSTFGRPSGY